MTPTNEATMREEFDAWVDTDPVFDPRSPLSIAWLAWQAARAASPDPPLDVGHLRSRFMSWLQQGCAPVDAFDKTMNVITEHASPDPAPVCERCDGKKWVWHGDLIRTGGPCPDCADPAPVKGEAVARVFYREGPEPKEIYAEWYLRVPSGTPLFTHPGMAEDAERLDRLQRLCFEYRNAASADAETWWQEIRALVTRRALQGNG